MDEVEMMDCLLGLDLGTSYFKALVIDREGITLGTARRKAPAVWTSGSGATRCLMKPEAFREALEELIGNACSQAGVGPSAIQGISYASQANSFLLLDRKYEPLTPVILWPDTRGKEPETKVLQLWERPDFLAVTGFGVQPASLMAAKIAWFQRHQPALWEKTMRIMSVSDYLSFGLTGVREGDTGTASLLGLLDVQRKTWWSDALSVLNIEPEMMSSPRPLCAQIGTTGGDQSELPVLPAGIPLFAGSLDHHLAAVGSGLGSLADVCDSAGTVSACLSLSQDFTPSQNICCVRHDTADSYFSLTFDNLGLPAAGDASDELLVQLSEVSHALIRRLSGATAPAMVVATGGGSRIRKLLQYKADITGSVFITTANDEPGAFGAAMAAAVGLGWFSTLREASAAWVKKDTVTEPAGRASS